jgi:hypothetical protein
LTTATLLIADNAMGKLSITTDGVRYTTTVDAYSRIKCYKTPDSMVDRYKYELNDLLKQACNVCNKYPCSCKKELTK